MSKVVVDRELLLQLFRCWDCGLEVDNELAQLRIAAAQPAEAEGVQLRRYTPISQGDHMPAMNSCDQGGWVRHSDYLAALSAVTAERDGLAAARMAYANEFAPDENGDPDVGNVHANIRALKAERDRLRDAAGKAIAWLDAEQNESGVGINRRLKLCRDAENSLRAAMAAKEA